ncbi:MAG: dehydrogenase [Hyphomicrobiales bacterium]|nr:MAG: dehydrogenase [Hyphomicrobiales bacterium]
MTGQSETRTALITGASAGIGAAFARLLAAKGFDLVLTARREARLDALAAELTRSHGITVHVLAADLARPETPQHLFDELTARGVAIDMLVNNAGYGVPGLYSQTGWDQQRDFIQVLVTAPAHLAHLFEPGMRARRYGRIINVASLAGLVPASAGHTLYGAAKAFMIRFSEAHALENEGLNVHVTALCPGFTYSEFHDVTGARELVSKLPRFMWQGADTVARMGYEAVMRGDAVCVTGRVNRLLALLSKYLPNWLARALSRSQGRKFRITEPKT